MTLKSGAAARRIPESATGTGLLHFALSVRMFAVLPGGTANSAGQHPTSINLLRDLYRWRWKERVTIQELTTRLFGNTGLDPYVLREVIDRGRYRPTGFVRVVEYTDPDRGSSLTRQGWSTRPDIDRPL